MSLLLWWINKPIRTCLARNRPELVELWVFEHLIGKVRIVLEVASYVIASGKQEMGQIHDQGRFLLASNKESKRN